MVTSKQQLEASELVQILNQPGMNRLLVVIVAS